MQSKKWLQNLDWYLIGAVCILAVFGIICIASALHFNLGEGTSEVYKQIVFFVIGLGLMVVAANVDYEYFSQYYIPIYFINIVLLLAVFVLGNESKGATRWIAIGPLTIQPSEFAKVMMIFFLAKFISLHQSKMTRLDFFLKLCVISGIPILLVLKQPALSASLVLVAHLLYSGIRGRHRHHLGAECSHCGCAAHRFYSVRRQPGKSPDYGQDL